MISTTPDPQQPSACFGSYWNFTHTSEVTVHNCTFADNNATGAGASAGALSVGPGGAITISNSTFTGCLAQRTGGAISVGGGGGSAVTCSLRMDGVTIADSHAGHGGSQLSVACAGDVHISGSNILMNDNGTQVRDPPVPVTTVMG